MRTALPFILVGLGLFTAGCIAFIAWELSADKAQRPDDPGVDESGSDPE